MHFPTCAQIAGQIDQNPPRKGNPVKVSDEKSALLIMRECPRWKRCSVPVCLLDLHQETRDYLPGEPKCTLSKAKRFQIGQGTALERQGLTRREWSARQREENLSDEAKRRRANNLEKAKRQRAKSRREHADVSHGGDA